MIIDQNLVLYEGKVVSGTGDAIALNSIMIPGKSEPILISLKATEALTGATSVTVILQQSATQGGTYTDVNATSTTIPAAEFVVGKNFGWRFLPRSVVNPWLRVKLTVSGNATTGKIFCGIMAYEDEPYEAGQYIDKGIVEG